MLTAECTILLSVRHVTSNGHANTVSFTSPTPHVPIKDLLTETPSNPLLRTANLRRLRSLADKYGFIVVVDDTVGSWVSVDVSMGMWWSVV